MPRKKSIPANRPPTPEKSRVKRVGLLYQFKITLLNVQPAIWRRIQVQDCTLDRLHNYIQTVMGWTNSHLHEFEIKGQRYGDPELLDDGFADCKCVDSTKTMLSDVLPKTRKRLALKYEYDFGDGWEHEILFEGCPTPAIGQKYPLCLEGERACPPEDVGGVEGYSEFLKSIQNRQHKKKRAETLEWVNGWFDPDEFDATTATKSMQKGLSDWRSVR